MELLEIVFELALCLKKAKYADDYLIIRAPIFRPRMIASPPTAIKKTRIMRNRENNYLNSFSDLDSESIESFHDAFETQEENLFGNRR